MGSATIDPPAQRMTGPDVRLVQLDEKINEAENRLQQEVAKSRVVTIDPLLAEPVVMTIAKLAEEAVQVAGLEISLDILSKGTLDIWQMAQAVLKLYFCVPSISLLNPQNLCMFFWAWK